MQSHSLEMKWQLSKSFDDIYSGSKGSDAKRQNRKYNNHVIKMAYSTGIIS